MAGGNMLFPPCEHACDLSSSSSLPAVLVLEDTISLEFNTRSIKDAMAHCEDEEERELRLKIFGLTAAYAKRFVDLSENEKKVVQATLQLIQKYQTPSRTARDDPKTCGRSFLDIINAIIECDSSPLGPEDQKTGTVKDEIEHRFVCFWCSHIYKKSSDLWGHLRTSHARTTEEGFTKELESLDRAEIESLSKPDAKGVYQSLRVFGEFSYPQIVAQGRDIPDWRKRRPRGSTSLKSTPIAKRPRRSFNDISDSSARPIKRIAFEDAARDEAVIDPQLHNPSATSHAQSPGSDSLLFYGAHMSSTNPEETSPFLK